MTLHTGAGCSITNNGAFTGNLGTTSCASGAGTDNSGCQIASPSTLSYGTGFNANGGGVYATQWTTSAISIFFFPRGSIPSDITNGAPNPTGWGKPVAQFQGACNIGSTFLDQQIVFDTTFCGDWAGAVWASNPTCSAKASTCAAYVQNNPGAFANAYWSVNSLKVYQAGTSSASVSASSTLATRTTSTTASVASATATGVNCPGYDGQTVISNGKSFVIEVHSPLSPPLITFADSIDPVWY